MLFRNSVIVAIMWELDSDVSWCWVLAEVADLVFIDHGYLVKWDR